MKPHIGVCKNLPSARVFVFCALLFACFLPTVNGTGTSLCWALSATDACLRAERDFSAFKSSSRAKYRQFWLEHANRFRDIYAEDPEGPAAPKSLYMAASVYEQLYRHSRKSSDLEEAVDGYERLCNRFPRSLLADEAQKALAKIGHSNVRSVQQADGADKAVQRTRGRQTERAKTLSSIKSIRYWSAAGYTRVVIDAEDEVSFEAHILKESKTGKKPARLYVDISGSCLSSDLQEPIAIGDGLLHSVRAGQYRKDTVRIVLDMESPYKHKVFNLVNPFRIVIDVVGARKEGKGSEGLTLAQQLGLGVKTIVLDAGHGGKDSGAIGVNGLKEKDVVLKVAKKLRDKIQERLPCKVILTRDSDVFLPLEERTAIANTNGCDLFVSIHANAAPNKQARGIETYFLNLSTDEDAVRVAARENATSTRNVSDLQKILNDLILNSKIKESCRVAECVQNWLVTGLSKTHDGVNNLGVKQAPFFVLIGAQMPSVLVEISFLSNDVEANLLSKDCYLNEIAEHLAEGVRQYADDTTKASARSEFRSARKP